jgi:hypothetical protein
MIRDLTTKKVSASFFTAALIGGGLFSSGPAQASGITFDVIGPHEYELPVDYKPFNVFVQYAYRNDDGQAFAGNGATVPGAHTQTVVGLSKYVRFWSSEHLPGIGLAYEVIQPEIRVDGTNTGVGGFGDTITGPAIWFKPTPNSTFGFQTFMSIPIGTSSVTNNYWANMSSFLYDYQWESVSFTGDTGAVFRSDRHLTGSNDLSEGTTYHNNWRFGWKNSSMIEPFFAFDWQTTGKNIDQKTNLAVYGSNSNEVALGGGLMFKIADDWSITGRYSHGVQGKNTPVTDSINLKLVRVW